MNIFCYYQHILRDFKTTNTTMAKATAMKTTFRKTDTKYIFMYKNLEIKNKKIVKYLMRCIFLLGFAYLKRLSGLKTFQMKASLNTHLELQIS